MAIGAADLHTQAYFADPFPVWERLRHDQQLLHDTVDDRWLLTRYDDVATVFREHGVYSTRPYERIFTDVIGPTMVQMDGDDHDIRRAIVAPVLVGRQLATNHTGLVEANPGTDLISGISHGRTEAGERLSRQEIASFIALMMVAGGETTDRGLANFLAVLLHHSDVLAAVRADPELLDAAFSEFMRRDGVVVYEDRELNETVTWYGATIPAGAIVRVAMISANNDETVFADPRRFDLTRPDLRLGKESRAGGRIDGVATHLGFGLGKHFCIGYQLARMEIVTATRRLLERYPDLRLAPGAEPRMTIDWFHRYVDRLVVDVA